MSNPTEILIEKLKLQRLLCERVFVKWEDQSGTSCTLGSRLNQNKQNLKFCLAVYYDTEGYIHVHFSLKVSITLSGNKQEMEMLLVVPPNANFADPSEPCLISNIDELSHIDASAIHEAEISDSVSVFRIQFDLSTNGFIVMKKKSTTIKPRNTSSTKLICGLESLSRTKTFTVYIKPNDYALVGIQEVRNRLSETGSPTNLHKPNMKEMYIRCAPELVEWSEFDPTSLPPVYTENDQLIPEVQVPQSPPTILEQQTPSINTIEMVIAETPTPTRISPSPAPVLHGIFSPSIEEPTRTPISPNLSQPRDISCPSIEELHDIEEQLRHVVESSRYIATNCNINSNEEHLVNLNSQEQPNQQAISKILKSKFVNWIHRARLINSNVYKHKRLNTKLTILGNCIRTSNTKVFDAIVPWCSALLFYNPFDSDNTLELYEKRNRWLISDIAELIKWANEVHYGAEMTSSLVNDFIKLGDIARAVALHPGYNKDEYELQKSLCIVNVFIEFGKPGASMTTAVSRKSLETDSNNPSKRVKI
ncbi:uncharacterized protein EAF01_004596 [Botrytis porri]|uniref:Uncharacterized protein n=1 Tax=Botrytis porri TaxID=87229 RepID=A0A4Z1KBG7_9HELO|nr:uncharacterized protein EAF01_004596 [Botrytis porri]KAF7907009.1 hypothetical protein EAF01_004596 [Botrytis porri]TGO83427.1 hypothetical protein BPOR_0650g00060 [Botrytis porri]